MMLCSIQSACLTLQSSYQFKNVFAYFQFRKFFFKVSFGLALIILCRFLTAICLRAAYNNSLIIRTNINRFHRDKYPILILYFKGIIQRKRLMPTGRGSNHALRVILEPLFKAPSGDWCFLGGHLACPDNFYPMKHSLGLSSDSGFHQGTQESEAITLGHARINPDNPVNPVKIP